MSWVQCSDRLPPIGRWVLCHHTRGTWIDRVLCHHTRGTWIDRFDQEGVDFVVLQRKHTWGNDDAYYWEQFGPDKFLAEDIDRWMEIPR